ncbi:hypothetical protein LEP1GSC126_2985 [Leptospira kirschneri str. 200801774]|uniref:hypothetical protein n=1 Tax=Leptospira kirschneri TaxID=29507 RepID=UPI0002BECCC0|nr:hypothetical protein [Leptospira kirschneri]EMO78989.1 hypothetical protein LEP1GSC126_2985 [Leptospira kirschneri str. 200801774]
MVQESEGIVSNSNDTLITKEDLVLIAAFESSFSTSYTNIVQSVYLISRIIERSTGTKLFTFEHNSWGPQCEEIFYVIKDIEKKEIILTTEDSNGFYKTFHITKSGYNLRLKRLKLLSRKDLQLLKKLLSTINDFTYLEKIEYIKREFSEIVK